MVPDTILPLLPLDRMQREIEFALSASITDATLADTGTTAATLIIPSLVEVTAVAVRHSGGSQRHLAFLLDRAADLAVAGASAQMVEAIFAYQAPHARKAILSVIHSLHQRAARAERGATAALMHTLGAAAPLVVRELQAELRHEHKRRASANADEAAATAAVAPARHGSQQMRTAADEYDYMLEENAAAEEEEYVATASLHRLQSDEVHACLPAVLACALHGCGGDDEMEARTAAVETVGRFMLSHERIAEVTLPALLKLVARTQPTAVRCAATLVFASLLVAHPAQAEAHCGPVLRSALQPIEPPALRRAALASLSDLILSRRLQPSVELPHVLPLLVEAADHADDRARALLSGTALSCIQRLAAAEGPARWSRMLHSTVLQLCPTLPPAGFSRMANTLIPSTMETARAQDLESLGAALVTHLADAAAMRAAARTTADVRHRTNLSALLGLWPPSDKSLAALQKALVGQSPLMVAATSEEAIRRGLQAHALKARAKCGGTVLEGISERLRTAKAQGETAFADELEDVGLAEDVSGGDAGGGEAGGGDAGGEAVAGVVSAEVVIGRGKRGLQPTDSGRKRQVITAGDDALGADEQRAAIEQLARNAIGSLKEKQPLYDSIRLPLLPPAGAGGKARAKGKRAKAGD